MRGTYQQIQLGTSGAEVWAEQPFPHTVPWCPPGVEWRDNQREIASLISGLTLMHKTVFIDAPTGVGKSILALSAVMEYEKGDQFKLPPVILTSNHGLQSQYESYGVPSITGRKNWPCLIHTDKTAEDAVCTTKMTPMDCPQYKFCPYFVQKRSAIESYMLVTNYHYALKAWGRWPATPRLIGDEAHSAENVLRENFTLRVYLPSYKVEIIDHSEGVQIAEDMLTRMELRFELEDEPDEDNTPVKSPLEKARIKMRTLRRMMSTDPDDYICAVGDDSLRFIPIRGLWPSVPTSLYLSATIFDPYVTDPPGPTAYVRLPSPFPVANRRVFMSNRVSLTHKSPDYEYDMLIEEIDNIIGRHRGRGVIHTPSYTLADRIYRGSAYQDDIITHKGGGRDDAVRDFKQGVRRVLLSPAVSEGVDFPGGECEWQVIAKLPFPDNRDPITKEIANRTKGLTETQVARTIVQQAGRGVRSRTDVCPTYILDAGFKRWFYPRNRSLFPAWFSEALTPL